MKRAMTILLAAALVAGLFSPAALAEETPLTAQETDLVQRLEDLKSNMGATLEPELQPAVSALEQNVSSYYSWNWSGSGTASAPYIVSSIDDLFAIGLCGYVDNTHFDGVYFKLDRNLTYDPLQHGEWYPLGLNDEAYFSGTFDGGGHTITTSILADAIGLCGNLIGGTIKDVTITNAQIASGDYASGIAGYAENATISNCHVSCDFFGQELVGGIASGVMNTVISDCTVTGYVSGVPADDYAEGELIGGITGASVESEIINCRVSGLSMAGDQYLGGIVGSSIDTKISGCAVDGYVLGNIDELWEEAGYYIGGIAGGMSGGSIATSYTDCEVTGYTGVGGIVGVVVEGAVTDCYSRDAVQASFAMAGGIAGAAFDSSISRCYALGDVVAVGGYAGGIAGSTEDNVKIADSVVLSAQVTAAGPVGRISGAEDVTVTNSYAVEGLTVAGSAISENGSGEDTTNEMINLAGFWTDYVGFGGAWNLAYNKLPVLSGVAGQSDTVPSRLAFTDPTNPLSKFTDLPELWYREAVRFVLDESLMQGTDETHFAPGVSMTRAMLVTVLGRLAEQMGEEITGDSDFTDVTADTWPEYVTYIGWASQAGIANGYPDGRFGTDDALTREQAAALIYRFCQYMDIELSQGATPNFTDADKITDTLYDEVMHAAAGGLISGHADGSFGPQDSCTRAQVAQIFFNFLAD